MLPDREPDAPPAGGFGEPKPGSLTLVVLIGVGFAAILLFGFRSAAGKHFSKQEAESHPCAEK